LGVRWFSVRPAPGGQQCKRSARQLRFADGGGAEPYSEEGHSRACPTKPTRGNTATDRSPV